MSLSADHHLCRWGFTWCCSSGGSSLPVWQASPSTQTFRLLLLLLQKRQQKMEVAPFMCDEKKVVTVTAFPMRMPSVFLCKLYYSNTCLKLKMRGVMRRRQCTRTLHSVGVCLSGVPVYFILAISATRQTGKTMERASKPEAHTGSHSHFRFFH